MDTIVLDAAPRAVLGKKVRFLRRAGTIPANIFGHNIPSLAVAIEEAALERTLARAGTNVLVTVRIAGAAEPRRVLIRGHQRRPTTGRLLHVDLYQVSMTEKLRTAVPIVLVGTAPGVDKGGVLLKNLDSLEIECLPGDLVPAIEVDISGLTDIDQAIEVRDLTLPSTITVLSAPETMIVKIMAPKEERAEAAAPAEAAAAVPEDAAGSEKAEG